MLFLIFSRFYGCQTEVRDSKSPSFRLKLSVEAQNAGGNLNAWAKNFGLMLAGLTLAASRSTAEAAEQAPDSEYVKTFKQFIESPPIIKSLRAKVTANVVSLAFATNDITNLESLLSKMARPAESDAVSQYLRTNLMRGLVRALTNQTPAEFAQKPRLVQSFVDDLNRIIQTRPLYQTQRFDGISIPEKTRELLGQKVFGPELTRLNRLLLLAAYPSELANEGHPVVKDTFLEIRYQPNAFYVKTATTLEGLDDSFVRPVGDRE